MLDVIIAGGGPAGLSAALILGRCRRRVLVCDSGRPRNWPSQHVGGFLTRDGTHPEEMRRIGRQQLAPYDGVEVRDVEVVDAVQASAGFEVVLADGQRLLSRKLLLATGVVDDLPPVQGAQALYGRGVYHCPYCDGWDLRDQPLAIYGSGPLAKALALELTAWSQDLILCCDGPADLPADDRQYLDQLGIGIREEAIAGLEGDGRLEHIRFVTGEVLPRRALFFYSCGRQASDLALRLGCGLTERGAIETVKFERTEVPGLYVAGDASRNVQLVVIAAAEGAMAAFAINTELLKENLKATMRAPRTADRVADQEERPGVHAHPPTPVPAGE